MDISRGCSQCFFKVSEIGFEEHDEDIVFKASEIVEMIIEIMDNEKKDEDRGWLLPIYSYNEGVRNKNDTKGKLWSTST